MSDDKINNLEFLDTIVFRSPSLPIQLPIGLEDQESFDKLLSSSWFLESIFIASPTLYERCLKYNSGKTLSQKKIKKLNSSVYNYYSRLRTRCTPYGLFAGCGTASWGTQNKIIISDRRVVTSIDIELQQKIAKRIMEWEGLFDHIKFFPNNSIYKHQNKFRFIEYSTQNKERKPQISSVEHSVELEFILDEMKYGKSVRELAPNMINFGLNQKNVSDFIRTLAKENILNSEFTPKATGNEFLAETIKKLNKINNDTNQININKLINGLVEIKDTLDKTEVYGHLNAAQIINEKFDELNIHNSQKILFNTQLYLNTKESTIDKSIKQKLKKTISFLNRICPNESLGRLQKFRNNFEATYGDQFIPLLKALDSHSGIGYPGVKAGIKDPILENISPGNNEKKELKLEFDEASKIIYKKILASLKKNCKIVYLRDQDFNGIDLSSDKLPNILSLSFKVFSNEESQIQFNYANRGIDFITRFMNDEEILKLGKEACEIEKSAYKHVLLTEVSHLPDGRGGNIVNRPNLRDYETPLLSLTGISGKNRIDLENLFIQVTNGRILLVDVKGREVIPKMTSAHNYHSSKLTIYRFLCDLQNQYYDKNVLKFEIDDFLSLCSYIPRIVYDDVIVSPATWKLHQDEITELKNQISNIDKVKKWQKKREIPDLVNIIKGDNLHLVNFNDLFSVKYAVEMIKNWKEVTFCEFLFESSDTHLISDENRNSYTNECFAFLNIKQNSRKKILNKTSFTSNVVTKYPPGSKWIYYKLYCEQKLADELLVETIPPLVEYLKMLGIIDGWFFIRYADPEAHIRFRLRVISQNDIGRVLVETYNMLQTSYGNEIRNIELSTYVPEIERYGRDFMEFSEKLFEVDSDSILKLLKLAGINDIMQRWRYAIKALDTILDTFEYDSMQKIEYTKIRFNSYFKEHDGDKKLKEVLNKKYRENRITIEDILDINLSEFNNEDPVQIALIEFKTNLSNTITKFGITDSSNLSIDSYCHMLVNRLFSTKQRTYEMVIFYLLFKFYKSKKARELLKD